MTKPFAVALATLLVALAAADASGHGRHHHHHHGSHGGWYPGVALSWGLAYPPYPLAYGYPYPYGYPYRYDYGVSTVVVEREPLVYVERERAAAPPAESTGPAPLWFYCPDPAGYYPHVPSCNQRWVTVDPATVAGPARQ
jgi:hypothetical protein